MHEVGKQIFKLADLNPAKYNPRKQLKPGDPEFEALARSMKEFGYVELILVNIRDGSNVIISEHQRWSVLNYLGETEAECLTVDLPEPEEKALNIAMNKISGQWDMEKLKGVLRDIDLSDLDATLTGFQEEELGGLIGDVDVDITTEDDFDALSEDIDSFVEVGDLIILGRHRLLCGADLDLLMDGKEADLILTDPLQRGEDTAVFPILAAAGRHLSNEGSVYVWYTEPHGMEYLKAFEDSGFYLSGCCIWERAVTLTDNHMTPACTAGKQRASIGGFRIGSRRPFGSLRT